MGAAGSGVERRRARGDSGGGAAGFFGWRAHETEQQKFAEQEQSEKEARAEKCRAAMEKALVHAYSGDFNDAHDAVLEAERLGAVAWEVRTRNSFILLQQSKLREASMELDQALELKPDSLAALSLKAAVASEEADNATI